MKKRPWFFILIFSASLFQLYAEEITFNSFIESVIDKHPQLKVYILAEDAARTRTAGILEQDKWLYSIKPFVNYFGEAAAAQYKSDSSTQYGTDFTISTPLGLSGGESGITASSTAEFHNPTSMEQPEELYKQGISAFYKQSLLRNRGMKEQKLLHEASGKELEITLLNNTELVEKLLLEFSLDFLEWVYLDEATNLLKERVLFSGDLLKQVELRFKNNLVDEIDVLRSRESLLNSRQALSQSEYQLERLRNSLDDRLSLGLSEKSKPVFDFFTIDTEIEKKITEEDLLSIRASRIIELEKEKLDLTRRRLEYLKDPDLNLSLSIGASSREITYSDSLSAMTPTASVSLALSGALNKKTVDIQLEENSILAEKTGADRENLLFRLDSLRNSLVTQLNQDRNFIINQDELVSIAKLKTGEERKYYNQGRGQLIYITQSLDNETLLQIKKLD
ncbi:MAG: TolC family protein, partial [Spirochaetia bacterium]|nr:TolC family protein [Spirochaetia bacterium]